MRTLVTGANGGLGPAIVSQFLSAGGSVVGVARAWPQQDPNIQQIAADLTRADECRRVALAAGAGVLVHVLGGFAGGATVADTDEDTWDKMMNLNLRSAFLMFRAILPGMIERGRGRIIAVGSRTAVEPAAGLSAYGVSKAGLVHLIRTLALELKSTSVTANIVLPSTIDTPANRAAMPGADASKWVSPESIAKLVSWLASDAAQDVSGAVIPIYGRA